MRLLQINVTANWGSHGKIAEEIGLLAMSNGWDSRIAYGRGTPTSQSNLIRIGNDLDMNLHGLQSRLWDKHGLASCRATRRFIKQIESIKPDVIHLHNIHGYYINYKILFDYLKRRGRPVIWTLHDCWSFTGHCAHYNYLGCDRWRAGCHNCPQLECYPKTWIRDRSRQNWIDKHNAFLGLPDLVLVPVSNWLKGEVEQSFLSNYPIKVIHNGIDLNVFRPSDRQEKVGAYRVLGVASVWDTRKGFDDFKVLRTLLPDCYHITLVGLTDKQISALPQGIQGIRRTNSVVDLARLYSEADVFVNPTYSDTYPTTNLEAQACGTPVVTYQTDGSPETITSTTGIVVPQGDIAALAASIRSVCVGSTPISRTACRTHAEAIADKAIAYQHYIDLYNELTAEK